MIVWGGVTTGPTYLNTGARYCAAAPTPAAPTALKATNVTATSFTANWSSVSGATGYRLDVPRTVRLLLTCRYQNLDVGNTTVETLPAWLRIRSIITGYAPTTALVRVQIRTSSALRRNPTESIAQARVAKVKYNYENEKQN